MLSNPLGKLLDNAKRTRLDTEFGALGNMEPEFWLFWALELEFCELFVLVLEAFAADTEARVRRRASAANVSNRPEKFRTDF